MDEPDLAEPAKRVVLVIRNPKRTDDRPVASLIIDHTDEQKTAHVIAVLKASLDQDGYVLEEDWSPMFEVGAGTGILLSLNDMVNQLRTDARDVSLYDVDERVSDKFDSSRFLVVQTQLSLPAVAVAQRGRSSGGSGTATDTGMGKLTSDLLPSVRAAVQLGSTPATRHPLHHNQLRLMGAD